MIEEEEIKKLREVYNFTEEEIKFLKYFKMKRNKIKGVNKLDLDFMRNEKGNVIREVKYKYLQSIIAKVYEVNIRGAR